MATADGIKAPNHHAVLTELCGRNFEPGPDQFPKDEKIHQEGKVHQPTFYVEVSISDIRKICRGPSVKKARQDACLAVLKVLAERLNDIKTLKYVAQFENPEVIAEDEIGKLPSMDHVGQNPGINSVGKLHELFVKNKWIIPVYETIKTLGPPHDRTFTVECIVYHEGNLIKKQATARSVKDGKKLAADQIMAILPISQATISPEAGTIIPPTEGDKKRQNIARRLVFDWLNKRHSFFILFIQKSYVTSVCPSLWSCYFAWSSWRIYCSYLDDEQLDLSELQRSRVPGLWPPLLWWVFVTCAAGSGLRRRVVLRAGLPFRLLPTADLFLVR